MKMLIIFALLSFLFNTIAQASEERKSVTTSSGEEPPPPPPWDQSILI